MLWTTRGAAFLDLKQFEDGIRCGKQAVVSRSFELWTTASDCAVVMDDGQGGERRQIVFDQPQVVWAFTCMTRLMQS